MELIEKNGKKYLKTFVAKINNTTIDMSDFFEDVEKARQSLLVGNERYLRKDSCGFILQLMMNRFSGNYLSPSTLSSYTENPAWSVLRHIFDQSGVTKYIDIGNDFHKTMEDYYKLEIPKRHKQYTDFIPADTKEREGVELLCNNYKNMNDYLYEAPISDDFECETELKIRQNIIIPAANYTLPFDVSCIIDRLDKRKEGQFVIDYKTGKFKANAVTFDGYLSAMLLYKLAFEQHIETEINGGWLCFPKDSEWAELDFSAENEKILAEKIAAFDEKTKIDAKRRVYDFTNIGFFNNPRALKFKNVMNDSNIYMAKIPVEIEL